MTLWLAPCHVKFFFLCQGLYIDEWDLSRTPVRNTALRATEEKKVLLVSFLGRSSEILQEHVPVSKGEHQFSVV